MATTIEDLLRSGPIGQLEQRCSDDHLLEISRWIPHWRGVSAELGLSDVEEAQIEHNPGGLSRQNYDMLRMWKARFLDAATYKKLANAFFNIRRQDLVERVRNLWKSEASPAQPANDVTLGVIRYAEYLKNVYEIKPCGDQWSPVVSKCYINLATVESIEDFPKEREEICTMAMIHSRVEEVKKLKRSIEIGQVGLLRDGQRARCIIVEGIPGIGKSTFSWHLGVCWAQKEILHGYHLVVLLRLRDERVQQAKCVSDLFYHHDQTTEEHEAVIHQIRSSGGDGVMLVLDGYDELSSHLQTSSIFADIIKGEVLPKTTVLVSSRPSANQNLRQLCQSQKCQFIEVIGFGKEEIRQYVDGALEHNKELRDDLKSYLEHHPHIHGLMYVPLNCAIVVQVFRDQMKNKSQPPQTHTEVYQLLVKTLLKRHEEVKPPPAKRHKSILVCNTSNNASRFPWLGDVSDETTSQLLVLAKLAYDGTKEDRLIFHRPSGTLETLGLLHEVPELYLESSGSSSYHFIHKTVQEFMAALYVSSLPPCERTKFVRTSFGKGNMTMVVRFMAGLTKFQSEDDREGILEFQKEGGRRLIESLHWLFEAHDPDLVQKCMGGRDWGLKLSGKTLGSFDCYALGYCIVSSRQPWSLKLKNCSISGECMKMLTAVEDGRAFSYIKSINLCNNDELGDLGTLVLRTMLGNNTVLTSLKMRDCGLGPEDLCEVCRAVGMNTTLTLLDLSGSSFDFQSVASLGAMLKKNKTLTSLRIVSCELYPEGLYEVCTAVEVNTTLTSLDLSHNGCDYRCLWEMLTKNKVLTSLELRECELGPEGLCAVFHAVSINTTLTSLDVSYENFNDFYEESCLGMNTTLTSLDISYENFNENFKHQRCVQSLGAMLQKNKVLTSLKLRACYIHVVPGDLCIVCTAVAKNTTLTSLDLSENRFDGQSITSLGTMLKENKTLSSLILENCGLGPKNLCELCSTIEANTTLTSLGLSWNRFDDQSITSLARLLSKNQILVELELQGCGLDDDTICSLAPYLMHCKLKKLDLSQNDVTERGADELNSVRNSCPSLTISYQLKVTSGR